MGVSENDNDISATRSAAMPKDLTRWSWAPLPHDGSVPYYAQGTLTSGRLIADLGLE
jgi:hypothetical protein